MISLKEILMNMSRSRAVYNDRWIEEVHNNSPIEGVPIFLIGNKKDLAELREVTLEEAEQFAKQHSIFFLETSALDNSDQMIEKVFSDLTKDIIRKKESEEKKGIELNTGKPINLSKANTQGAQPAGEKKKGCC